MIVSNKIYSAQKYLEIVLDKTYIISGDNDIEFVERMLEVHEKCLWNYPLNEINHVLENDLDVILVDYMVYNNETHEYEHVYRWSEVDGFEDLENNITEFKESKNNIFYFDIKEICVKTVGIKAEDFKSARENIETLHADGKIKLNHTSYDYVSFKSVQKTIEENIDDGFIDPEELDTF